MKGFSTYFHREYLTPVRQVSSYLLLLISRNSTINSNSTLDKEKRIITKVNDLTVYIYKKKARLSKSTQTT